MTRLGIAASVTNRALPTAPARKPPMSTDVRPTATAALRAWLLPAALAARFLAGSAPIESG